MRVSEIYASTQGEGPNVGKTSVFTRFGGCNLRCPGWPCDTQFAIDPQYRNEWDKGTPLEVAKAVRKVAELAGSRNITLTGGEPFLQPGREMRTLIEQLRVQDWDYTIDAFTNGTLLYDYWAAANVTMIMDWKLPGSGEDPLDKNRIENLEILSEYPSLGHSVKFVCKDVHDLLTAHSLWSVYLKDRPIEVYYGRVWDGNISNAELVEYVMREQLPWRLNVQTHNYIWPADERGR